jgi:hypothetical protein
MGHEFQDALSYAKWGNQDPLGREAHRAWKQGDLEIWSKPMQDGSRAVLLLNCGAAESEITVPWTAITYPDHLSALVRDPQRPRQIHRQILRPGPFPRRSSRHHQALVAFALRAYLNCHAERSEGSAFLGLGSSTSFPPFLPPVSSPYPAPPPLKPSHRAPRRSLPSSCASPD